MSISFSEAQAQAIERALFDGFREGIINRLKSGYNTPFDKAVDAAISPHLATITTITSEIIREMVGREDFREQIKSALTTKLAKLLIERFGGELEKQVNVLKSDPTTRARITTAIEDIVKSAAK